MHAAFAGSLLHDERRRAFALCSVGSGTIEPTLVKELD
eukprot:CAMPEP_0119380152 /NCGR_PEP_ID=MMETSP1334-20130426/55736_1 /TAXON_ID=127549 /ORGANISM="Calcidiscus leptoporus, Strain RCC1130" /LENGTH=37 /DNA_ID= /DNA_START= /DNA_END= /DNA_ORIENTATION=